MRELHHAPRPVVQHQQTWRLHTRTAQRVRVYRRMAVPASVRAFGV